MIRIYFSDFFEVVPEIVENYGAFNISLLNDLPLFIDPFLLFGSDKEDYKELHEEIISYLVFLKNKSEEGIDNKAQIKSWYLFPEVKQNWFGYSKIGNSGSGLGMKFGKAFSSSMHMVFDDLGNEKVTQTSHLEKASLFRIGIGKDNISDFTTNLIKNYLLNYTQNFAKKYIDSKFLRMHKADKVYFDYDLERWMPKEFLLPTYNDDFVLLTPKDILTKDDTWINKSDLKENFSRICNSIPNDQLRNEINNYFKNQLPSLSKRKRKHTQKERSRAIQATIDRYPVIMKWFIKEKEESKTGARSIANDKVFEVEKIFVKNLRQFVTLLEKETDFYKIDSDSSYKEAMKRVQYLKDFIENNDGYKLFYIKGEPIKKETDLQLLYRLTWYASDFDVNREPNNGRGPVDYSISMGAKDKTLVEFKLAKNTKLKQNLINQVGIYEEANKTKLSIKVILYFDESEEDRVHKILKELKISGHKNIILIDASKKISASKVK